MTILCAQGGRRSLTNTGLRQRQAAATRRQMVEAAKEIFELHGFERTRFEDVAARAGVAVPTVYKAFTNKANLLIAAVTTAMSGAPDAPIDQQAWWQEQVDEPQARRQLALIARNARRIYERAGVLLAVVRAATPADPQIEALWQRLSDERYRRSVISGGCLRAKTIVRKGLGAEDVARTLWALSGPELYVLQVEGAGLTAARYERWIARLLINTLLPDDAA